MKKYVFLPFNCVDQIKQVKNAILPNCILSWNSLTYATSKEEKLEGENLRKLQELLTTKK